MEIWKVWKETYSRRWGHITWEVSDQGNVKRNGELYECKLDKKGYKVFGTRWTLHRVVAQLFVPNPENKLCVDHINTNKLDNRVCNLRWCTYKENMNNPITRKGISESMKGRSQSEETRRKKSESMKGRSQSEDHRRKNSEAHKGKPKSEESKRKQSESMKRYWKNKKEQNIK